MRKTGALQQEARTSTAISIIEPLGVPEVLRAMLVESLYEAQAAGVSIHPLLLESSERHRRELLLKESAHADKLKTSKLERQILRSKIHLLRNLSKKGRLSGALTPIEGAQIRQV